MVAMTLPQLVTFIPDAAIKEDYHRLLVNGLESLHWTKNAIAWPQHATRSLSSRTYVCWETASVYSLQVEHLHKAFSLEAVGSRLAGFSKARVFSVSFIPHCSTRFQNAPLSPACSEGLTLLFLMKHLSAELATGSEVFSTRLGLVSGGAGAGDAQSGLMKAPVLKTMQGCAFLLPPSPIVPRL
jgi:hypothetical protein